VYPSDWSGGDEIQTAKKLEKRYPEKILKYYVSGLGNLTINATRKEYARKAKVMSKVHRLLVEVLGDEARWKKFATKVKQANIQCPASLGIMECFYSCQIPVKNSEISCFRIWQLFANSPSFWCISLHVPASL